MGVDTGEIQAIRWIYPIIGLPEAKHEAFIPGMFYCQKTPGFGGALEAV